MNPSERPTPRTIHEVAELLAPIFQENGWWWGPIDPRDSCPQAHHIVTHLERALQSLESDKIVSTHSGRILVTIDHDSIYDGVQVFLHVGDLSPQEPEETSR